MAALRQRSTVPSEPARATRQRPRCAICGSDELWIDSVETLELCECLRCRHRSTRPLGVRPLAIRRSRAERSDAQRVISDAA